MMTKFGFPSFLSTVQCSNNRFYILSTGETKCTATNFFDGLPRIKCSEYSYTSTWCCYYVLVPLRQKVKGS